MASNSNIHILLAEDDNFQRLTVVDILCFGKYQVTAVENGKLARDELLKEDSNIDMVLLDIKMPEIGGQELLSFIIPVIMMCHESEKDIAETCMANGAKDYLVKPITFPKIKDIAKHIQKAAA